MGVNGAHLYITGEVAHLVHIRCVGCPSGGWAAHPPQKTLVIRVITTINGAITLSSTWGNDLKSRMMYFPIK